MISPETIPLGVIAGSGKLPVLLMEACRQDHRPFTVIGIKGSAKPSVLDESKALWIRIGEAGKAFEELRRNGVIEVVLAGKVERPRLADMMPDMYTAKFIARVGKRAFLDNNSIGDDYLLRGVISEFEAEGFRIIGVDAILPDLLAKPGLFGKLKPTPIQGQEIGIGAKAAKELGQRDVGQAVVVENGRVILAEREKGTDALIEEGGRKRSKKDSSLILVKTMKPGQDRRIDLPVIGPETISKCAASRFSGIAIEANHTLVLNKSEVGALANEAGLFIVAIDTSKIVDAGIF